MPLFEPNSFNGPVEDHRFDEPPLKLSSDAARYNHREGNDDYRQAGDLFRLIGKEAQQRSPSPSGIFWSGYGTTHDGNLETQLEKFPQCDSNAPRSRRSPPVRVAQHRPYSQSPNCPRSKRLTENELSDFSRLWHDGCVKAIIEAQDVDRNHPAQV